MANVTLTMENLKKRGFSVSHFADKASCAAYLLSEIGDKTVGIGGSVTIDELGIYPTLQERREGEVFWHWFDKNNTSIQDLANAAPVYLMSANGVSESGLIHNIDGRGNRVANMCYGHEKVYIVIGINKIAPNDEMALWRARHVAGVKNARRLQYQTACMPGEELKCFDCDGPNRICRIFISLTHKPSGIGDVEVVIVDEALGF